MALTPHAPSTLVSLRSFVAPGSQLTGQAGVATTWGARHLSTSGGAAQQAVAAPTSQQDGEADEESLEQIRARIFGTHIGNGLRSGRKVLRKPLVGQRLVDYYPPDPTKHDPLMLDLKAESAKLKLAQLRRRGKGPPKKGAGKRSSKKR